MMSKPLDASPTLDVGSASHPSSPALSLSNSPASSLKPPPSLLPLLNPPLWRRLLTIISYIPPRCRWDPASPPAFSMSLNILFAFAAGFTVANLYYNHPILNILAKDFGVEYEKVAQIPTVMQGGYAAGLIFLCPLGDLVPRRGFVVGLVGGTGMLWYVKLYLFLGGTG